MNIVMFIVGFVIFKAYVGFLMWNIFYNHNKNREENYPGYYTRHNQPVDMEVMTHYPHNRKAKNKRRSRKKIK
jgi:hypothetical protein